MAILGALLGLAVGLPKYLQNPTNVELGALFAGVAVLAVLAAFMFYTVRFGAKGGITRGAVAGIGMLLIVYFISGQIVLSLR
jgi:uncharacterized BrkB/YihY/UPF0761 family membrane protein